MKDVPNFNERYKKIKQALEAEQSLEKELFETQIHKSSIQELKSQGMMWYPLLLMSTGYTLGEHPIVELKNETLSGSHIFKNGSIISFFHNTNGDFHAEAVRATVYSVDRNVVKIILDEDLPDWHKEGKIGIVIDYDQKTIQEMFSVWDLVNNAKDNRIAYLRDILYQKVKTLGTPPMEFHPKNPNLNHSQIQAIGAVLGSKDVEVIHGPPGTGKTTTLAECIFQLAKQSKKILCCAPSNYATDLLVEKSAEQGLKVLRLGNVSRIQEDLLSYTLEYQVENSNEFAQIKKMRKKINELSQKAVQFRRNFGTQERDERKEIYKEIRELRKYIIWLEDGLAESIVSQAQVICTTLVGSTSHHLKSVQFDVVIIDEVSQAMEPATWIPIQKGTNLVLAGDPFQLPPTVKSQEADKLGLSTTLLDLAYALPEKVHLLNVQYRMHESILGFSNLIFYKNEVQSADSTRHHGYNIEDKYFPNLLFVDTAGCGFDEVQNETTLSQYNPEEATLLLRFLNDLLIELSYKFTDISVGVISPYKAQVDYLIQFDRENQNLRDNFNVDIATIDSFQGQERDIIFISSVRSNSEGQVGFLKDYRRMNVAFTRARKMLTVFGDSATLSMDDHYRQWIDYCQQHDFYRSAWEWM